MNSKRAIGLTPQQLDMLDWYFWDETRKSAFIYELNTRLGHGDGFAEQILIKLSRAADAARIDEERKSWPAPRQDRLDWFHRQLDNHAGEDVS